ncbi:MAG TPA: hypothetical protein VEB66_05245 [Opitutaceae bacterium]|nr:hypothetical protein [Opitutaceae bacterium]
MPVVATAEPKRESKMAASLRARADVADAVAKGESPRAALEKLKTQEEVSGLPELDRDADFAFAAIDIGLRLVAAGRNREAEEFFREAEAPLEKTIRKTPDALAREKSMYLQKLAFIRSQFLNKRAEAKADLDRAVELQPADELLLRRRDHLLRERGEPQSVRPKS